MDRIPSAHPPPSTGLDTPLADQINVSSRQSHTTLNALIISLLPQALPPIAPNATTYAHGMAQILPIYAAFESSFTQAILTQTQTTRPSIRKALQQLHFPALDRADRLAQDISALVPTSPRRTIHQSTRPSLPRLTAFVAHIQQTLLSKPHLLLAYTHIFYLALFSGGRYIRAKLRAAGIDDPSFYKGRDVDAVLSFWSFDDKQDGEGLKAEFKRRFAVAEKALSEDEREEVVGEAIWIMDTMVEVVGEMADVLRTDRASGDQTSGSTVAQAPGALSSGEKSMHWLLLKHVLPMGLVELLTSAAGLLIPKGDGAGNTLAWEKAK